MNTLHPHTRKIILNVYDFFVKRKGNVNSIQYIQDINIIKYVAEITGLSENIIKRLVRERSLLPEPSTKSKIKPGKIIKRKKNIVLDESALNVIKQIVSQYHAEEKKLPSLLKLKTMLRKEGILDCGVKYLSTVLCKLGFKYKNYCPSEIEEECTTLGYEVQQAAGDLVYDCPKKNNAGDTDG